MFSQDTERTREIYTECLKLIPHKTFTFAKIWLLAAQFEIRQLNLQGARKLLGQAIGMCPKNKLFKGYIELEMQVILVIPSIILCIHSHIVYIQLREFDRCRTLYTKFLEYDPANCSAWIKFAELEKLLGEQERCRAIFELAISQPSLDMPELLWKAYIGMLYSCTWDQVKLIIISYPQTLRLKKKNMTTHVTYTYDCWSALNMSRSTSALHNLNSQYLTRTTATKAIAELVRSMRTHMTISKRKNSKKR